MSFTRLYREVFRSFGYPLGASKAMAASTIDRAAASLDVVVPKALRDFYLVAGRERRFSRCHNRILAPKQWRLSKQRLVFMEENQWVVWWGVSVRTSGNDDPPVGQAVNNDSDDLTWRQESRRCSVFLAVMLHFQAVSGGLPYYGLAAEPKGLKRKLKADWKCYGTVNRLTAYSRRNQVICVEPSMGVAAAAKTRADLSRLQEELSLSLT